MQLQYGNFVLQMQFCFPNAILSYKCNFVLQMHLEIFYFIFVETAILEKVTSTAVREAQASRHNGAQLKASLTPFRIIVL